RQEVLAPGVYDRADPRPPLARPARDPAVMAIDLPFRLILASASTARRDLLTRAGYAFKVLPARIDEPTGSGFTDPRSYVQQVAWMKAAAVASNAAEGVVL